MQRQINWANLAEQAGIVAPTPTSIPSRYIHHSSGWFKHRGVRIIDDATEHPWALDLTVLDGDDHPLQIVRTQLQCNATPVFPVPRNRVNDSPALRDG